MRPRQHRPGSGVLGGVTGPRLAGGAALAALLLASPAPAATLTSGADGSLIVTGRDNAESVTVAMAAPLAAPGGSAAGRRVLVRDAGRTLTIGTASCLDATPVGVPAGTVAACTVAVGSPVVVLGRGGDDVVEVTAELVAGDASFGTPAVRVEGEGGDDRITTAITGAPSDAFANPIVLADGGEGADAVVSDDRTPPRPDGTARIRASGGAGADRLTARRGRAEFVGGADSDQLAAAPEGALLRGGPGADILDGAGGPDALFGDGAGDVLEGRGGDDVLDGGLSGDILDGGPGVDTLRYDDESRVTGVVVTLGGGCDDGGPQDTRTPLNIVVAAPPGGCQANGVDRDDARGVEALIGTRFPDTLIGAAAGESLFGLDGDDLLEGAAGADAFQAGTGADTILARDGVTDQQVVCQGTLAITGAQPDPGDRALLDNVDPADPDCTTIDRGGAGVTGPQDPRPAPAVPPPGEPVLVPPGPAPIAVDPQSGAPLVNGGTGPGAAPGGRIPGRPPELRIVTRRATPDRAGRLSLRIACVYRARACRSTVELRTVRALRARIGERTVRLAARTRAGRAQRTIPWGRSEAVRIPTTAAFRRVLAHQRRPVTLRMTVSARDGAAGAGAPAARAAATVTVGRTVAPRR